MVILSAVVSRGAIDAAESVALGGASVIVTRIVVASTWCTAAPQEGLSASCMKLDTAVEKKSAGTGDGTSTESDVGSDSNTAAVWKGVPVEAVKNNQEVTTV